MTVNTVCNVIQAFPVLLILAQNANKCLKTPLIYKPPSPTHTPEYYEAYDALLNSLLHDKCNPYKKSCYPSYPSYPDGYGYGQPHGYADKYPSFESYPDGYVGYSHNRYRVADGYNMSTNYLYKTNYAPSQVYNTKQKNKIVVVKKRGHRKFERLQGFFPQRDDRRISSASPFGFIQNVIPNPSRIRNTLNGLIHFTPGNGNGGNVINNGPDPYQTNRPYNAPESDNSGTNTVRFPIQDVPNDQVNFEPQSTSNEVKTENSGLIENHSDNSGGFISGTVATPAYGERDNVVFGKNNPTFENRNGESSGGFSIADRSFEETCVTVDGGEGSCIVLTGCQPYIQLLSRARTDAKSRMILQRSQCGFEGSVPKVCCPKPGIPSAPPTEAPTTTTQATTTTTAQATTEAPKNEPIKKTVEDSDFLTAFPEPPVCGVSSGFFGKVVGGVDAKLGDFPWIARLGYLNKLDQTTRWRCGGSLITAHHVLTAAHCIHNHEVDLYVVRLGELDFSREDDGATPIDVLIKSKVKHEQYNSASFENDIGVLILQQYVEFTKLINPICLPVHSNLRSQKFERLTPMIAGWGDVQFRGPSANHLQVVQLPVQTNDLCIKSYAKYPKQIIDERVLCAGYKDGGKDACQGDSGGPLMLPNWNNVTFKTYFYQIGVVSYGKNCAEAGFPGVYSRVTHFMPWLEKVVLGI